VSRFAPIRLIDGVFGTLPARLGGAQLNLGSVGPDVSDSALVGVFLRPNLRGVALAELVAPGL
jgi:hypothetical protein